MPKHIVDHPYTLATWKAEGCYFSHYQNQIFYKEDYPESEHKILLLHGFPTSSWDYHRIWSPLKLKSHLIAPDFIGFGFSDKPKHYPYSIHDQTDMVVELLTLKAWSNVTVIAHNYGSIVGQELILRNNTEMLPFNIEKVIFLNGALFPELHQPTSAQKLLLSPLGAVMVYLFNQTRFEKSFKAVFGRNTQPNKHELDELWQLITYHDGQLLAKKLLHYINDRKMYGHRWVDAMKHSKAPIKFINGIDDPVSGLHVVEKYLNEMKNPNVLQISDVGHYPQLESPEQVLRGIYDFVYS